MNMFEKKLGLDALRPHEWFNIPAPVCDAVAVLVQKLQQSQDNINHLQTDLRQTQMRFAAKEKRQKDSIREVLEYCKEEINAQGEVLTENLENMSETLHKNSKKVTKRVKNV